MGSTKTSVTHLLLYIQSKFICGILSKIRSDQPLLNCTEFFFAFESVEENIWCGGSLSCYRDSTPPCRRMHPCWVNVCSRAAMQPLSGRQSCQLSTLFSGGGGVLQSAGGFLSVHFCLCCVKLRVYDGQTFSHHQSFDLQPPKFISHRLSSYESSTIRCTVVSFPVTCKLRAANQKW